MILGGKHGADCRFDFARRLEQYPTEPRPSHNTSELGERRLRHENGVLGVQVKVPLLDRHAEHYIVRLWAQLCASLALAHRSLDGRHLRPKPKDGKPAAKPISAALPTHAESVKLHSSVWLPTCVDRGDFGDDEHLAPFAFHHSGHHSSNNARRGTYSASQKEKPSRST